MAANVIRVSLLADASKMKAGLKDADQAVGNTEKSITGFGKAAVAGFAVVAAGAVVSFAKDAVQAFSEVEQSAGAVESVFGESADAITGKAADAAEAFGLSAADFQSSAVLIGSMLKNQMGLSAEEAAGEVDGLIGKASDMAATFGGTTTDAITAIGSLLRGERDPIEKYGVSMNDASIKARALELGLVDVQGELTPTAKATAALDILNQQTATSTGQFARESDTLAGSQQILAAKITNAKAAIGEQLAPAVSTATTAVEAMIPFVETLTTVLGGAVTAADPLITDLGDLAGIAPESGAGLENVGQALAHAVLPFLGPVTMGFENIKDVLGVSNGKFDEAVTAMDKMRRDGLEPNVEAEEDLATAIRDTITVRQEANDQMRAQIDPFFALVDAVDAQAEAQRTLNELEANGVTGGLAYEEALRLVAEKSLDVEDAQLRLLTSGGLTREEFENQRVKMKLTEDQAQYLIDKYDLLFTPRSVTHTTTIQYNERTAQTKGQQHGGLVTAGTPYTVGEAGRELFVPSSNGRIVPHGSFGNGSGGTVNLHIHADRSQPLDGWKIIEALQQVERRNGPLPISVRT